jgi:hypothetical protein
MSKPSIAELLIQSGQTTFTFDLVTRAIKTLYGQIGAGLDERNWTTILTSSNALASAETALVEMYQSAGYLLRNANHLIGRGYDEFQIELTYRKIYNELGISYSPSWALNSAFQRASEMTLEQLLAITSVVNLPIPTLTFTATEAGLSVTLSEAGTLFMSVSGNIGNYAAGTSLLLEQNNISTGFLTLTGSTSNKTSTATTAFVTLGRATGDGIFLNDRENFVFSGAGNDIIFGSNQNDYINGGADRDILFGDNGADTLVGGSGVDELFGEAGNDILFGGDDNDFLFGGNDDDNLNGGTGVDSLDGGNGSDTLNGGLGWDILEGGPGTDYLFLNSEDLEQEVVILNINNDGFDVIDGFHFGGGLGGFGFDRMNLTSPAGLGLIGGAAGSLTTNINDGIGTTADLNADTAASVGVSLNRIAGADDQLGAGTTIANAVTRAETQLSDGVDFLGNTTAANQGALALLTDNGTNHYLFLVVDANNDHVTNAGEVTLIAVFTNSTNINDMVMADFNTAAG